MPVSLLAISDIHGKEGAVNAFCKWVREKKHTFDALVVAGDMGNPQKIGSMCKILRMLKVLNRPIYYVKGNWDVREDSCTEGIDLEEKPVDLGSVIIIGHGRRMSPFKKIPSNKPILLVTHYPPFSIMDRSLKPDAPHGFNRSGLPEVNYLVDTYKPKVHVFGHSHSLGGIDLELNGVRYVNVARLDRVTREGEFIGNYALITFSDNGAVKIDWFFLNSIKKHCSICGRSLYLPKKWSICRKCANRNELEFKKINKRFSLFKLQVVSYSNTDTKMILSDKIKIPISTIKNKECLEDFLDLVIRRITIKKLRSNNDKVLLLPKDKVIDFYRVEHEDGVIVPFSEYLFSCREDSVGKRLCALMKLFSLEKKVYVIWTMKKLSNNRHLIQNEYVLFNHKLIVKRKDLLSTLLKNGFSPMTYKLTPIGSG